MLVLPSVCNFFLFSFHNWTEVFLCYVHAWRIAEVGEGALGLVCFHFVPIFGYDLWLVISSTNSRELFKYTRSAESEEFCRNFAHFSPKSWRFSFSSSTLCCRSCVLFSNNPYVRTCFASFGSCFSIRQLSWRRLKSTELRKDRTVIENVRGHSKR